MIGRAVSVILSAVLGGVIGLVAFESSLGLALANPRHVDWLLDAGDRTTHFLGWHMFRHEAWSAPLGAIQSFGYPVGTSVALTDSIPALALPFKALVPAAGDFQYIGLWLLACFVLQGVFGALLAATATGNVALRLLGAALFVLTPMLVHRVGHAALASHWLLLASLWITFTSRADHWSARTFALWFVLVAIAGAAHPYIGLMVLALVAAHYARVALVSPRHAAVRALLPLAALLAGYGVVSWQAGYFVVDSGSDLQASGVGFYSMNVLSLLMPMGASRLFGHGPFAPATEGQYEGYAYLGAGQLLLMMVAAVTFVVTARRLQWRRWIEYAPFALACLTLTLLALSPAITAGSRTLFTYDEAWLGPFRIFRASGRLFWPVYYALVGGAVVLIVVRYTAARAIAILTLAVVLQAIDVSSQYRGMQVIRTVRWTNPLPSEFWPRVLPHYDHLTLLPTNMCGGGPPIDYTPFALHAGRAGVTINAGFAARYDARKVEQYCQTLTGRLRQGDFARDEIYVTLPKLVPVLSAAPKTPLACTYVDGYAVCVVRETYLGWQDEFDITRGVLPPLDDLIGFRGDLEADYRDGMKRPAAAASGSIDERVRAIARYLTYRLTGCTLEEAQSKVVREIAGARELRLCGDPLNASRTLPPAGETHAFRQRLETAYREAARPPAPSHVDPEGEAVWMHEYVGLRLSGQSDADARRAVLATIRSMTGR